MWYPWAVFLTCTDLSVFDSPFAESPRHELWDKGSWCACSGFREGWDKRVWTCNDISLLSLIRCCGVRWQQGWGDQGSWHSICFSWWCRRVGLKLVFTLILLGVLLWKIVPLPGCQLAESSAWDSWSWKGGRERRNVCERNVYNACSVCVLVVVVYVILNILVSALLKSKKK